MAYEYDQAGNRELADYPTTNLKLQYSHTDLDQVDDVDITEDGSSYMELIDYTYFVRLLNTRYVRPDTSTHYTFYPSYDKHRRITTIQNGFSDGNDEDSVARYDYEYDAWLNVTQQSANGAVEFRDDDRDYIFDDLDRLTGVEYVEHNYDEVYDFDLVGNRTQHIGRNNMTKDYVLDNEANEYDTIDTVTVYYDSAGNLTQDEDEREYFYDELNRLTSLEDSSDAELAAYVYDALGRRIESRIDGSTTRYYYDGDSVIEEYDESNGRLRYHVNGSQFVDERAMTYTDSGSSKTFYLLNRNYSVAGTGNEDGTTLTRFDYTPGGDFQGSIAPASGTFTLHGRAVDGLSDGQLLHDFRARTYDAQHGRWLQRDPSGFADGPSLVSARSSALG